MGWLRRRPEAKGAAAATSIAGALVQAADATRALVKVGFLISNRPKSPYHAYDLSLAEADVLTTTARAPEGQLSCSEIAENVITEGDSTKVLDRLDARGLVKRISSRDDRRSISIQLSANGESWRRFFPEVARGKRKYSKKRFGLNPIPRPERSRREAGQHKWGGQMTRSITTWLVLVLTCLYVPVSARGQSYSLESTTVSGTATGSFHTEMIEGRWWIVAPDGKADFIRSISIFDTTNGTDSFGGFRHYDKVVANGVDVTASAMDSHPGDAGNYRSIGNALTIGSSRFQPEYVYWQASQNGVGGLLRWFYYGKSGWTLINGNGVPYRTTTPYPGVNASGFAYNGCTTCRRLSLWNPQNGWPLDFKPAVISSIDSQPRYYLRAMVANPYTTALILSQIYERANPDELIQMRYGGGYDVNTYATPWIRWINNDTLKLINSGINGAGYYSYRYEQFVDASGAAGITVTQKLPHMAFFAGATAVMRAGSPYSPSPIKNVYGNISGEGVCPGQYKGRTPDVFDPSYAPAMAAWAMSTMTAANLDPTETYILIPEEADDLYGLNNLASHQHMGFIIAAANPYMPKDLSTGKDYSDPILHSKYALEQFLETKYTTIQNLNASWGTSYTTWNTSSGNVAAGTNAYGVGTGFMDENGNSIYAGPSNCQAGIALNYVNSFSTANVRTDLDAFVLYFAQTYGQDLQAAIAATGLSHAPVFAPLYNGPDQAYTGITPYVDGFWTNPGHNGTQNSVTPADSVADVKRIYNDAHKPLIVADYQTANASSQDYFFATVTGISGSTINTSEALHYELAQANVLTLTDGGCGQATTVNNVDWNAVKGSTLTLASPLTCASVGNHVRLQVPVAVADSLTRRQQAATIIARWQAVLNAQGSDGARPVVGFEHWSLYDEAVSEYASPPRAFGFFTLNDNPIDGISDTIAPGVDTNGYPSGGEEANYGNLLSGAHGVGTFLRTIYQEIQ